MWPRGLTKANACVDLWLKEIAPSADLRRWYGHDANRWAEFRTRYLVELDGNQDAVGRLLALAKRGELTLLYASRDLPGSSAEVLQAYLLAQASSV